MCRTASSSTCVQNTTTGARIWHWNRTSRVSGELQASDEVPLVCICLGGILWIVKCSYTVMRRLTMRLRSEKCVVWRFRRSANVIQFTYTNLDSIAYYSPRFYGIAYCSLATKLYSMLLY